MWRKASRKEYHYISRMEDAVMRQRVFHNMAWVLIALAVILAVTCLNQLREREWLAESWQGSCQDEPLLWALYAIGSGGSGDMERLDSAVHAVTRARKSYVLDYTYRLIYIGECMAAAAIHLFYRRSVYLRKRRFLKGHIYIQDAVCIDKKTVRSTMGKRVAVHVVTDGGKALSDIVIPDPVHRSIECGRGVILAAGQIEDGKNMDGKERIDVEYERNLRVYPF